MARRANDREAAARTAGAETIRLSRFRVAGDDRTFSRGRGSRPVPADGRTGVDLLARRPSHILDRLQESAGGGHELVVRISRPQPPAADHYDPAGRCPQHPGLRRPGAPGAGWRTSGCPMTALWATATSAHSSPSFAEVFIAPGLAAFRVAVGVLTLALLRVSRGGLADAERR